MAIIYNRIQCNKCKDIITSLHRYDFIWCKCRSVAVDGGFDYIKRIGNLEDITDLSQFSIDDPDRNNPPLEPPTLNQQTRMAHLAWCKSRAIPYANHGNLLGAFGSMISDLSKHNETRDHQFIKIGIELFSGGFLSSNQEMIDFIEGFN